MGWTWYFPLHVLGGVSDELVLRQKDGVRAALIMPAGWAKLLLLPVLFVLPACCFLRPCFFTTKGIRRLTKQKQEQGWQQVLHKVGGEGEGGGVEARGDC